MTEERRNDAIGDPLIDEVRALRRSICDAFDNDVNRICDHLQEVETEYRSRTGRFADVPRQLPGELFPESAGAKPDPLLQDVRNLRR